MKSEGMKDDRMAGDGMAEELCCCHKHKERSEKEYRDLINRLNRIEGQIRGINKLILNFHFGKNLLSFELYSF